MNGPCRRHKRPSIAGKFPLLFLFLLPTALMAGRPDRAGPDTAASIAPAESVLATAQGTPGHELFREILSRNPEVLALEAAARASAQRAPQVAALPDPTLGLTAYLWPPETRVGPQRFMASLSERFPWFGKLGLREKAAVLEAAAARASVEAARLRVLTEARRLADELAFLDAFEKVVREDRATLAHYEELARARYTSGVGLEQPVVKLQAEITKDDGRLLDIATRQADLRAGLNALGDRPQDAPLPAFVLPTPRELRPARAELRERALALRPELAAAAARIERARILVALAKKEARPDVTLGLVYTAVGNRTDAAGVASPPPDNGQDVFGITGGVNLPIWSRKIAAGIEEGVQKEHQAEEEKRSLVAAIDRAVGDLTSRIPLTWERLRLFENVLLIQADQSLRSAETGYESGTLNALDLLDAERVLLDVKIATARARADYAVAIDQLEGAVGVPLDSFTLREERP